MVTVMAHVTQPQAALPPNLVLIGYRATGKTSVGARLAEVLQRPFLDLDQVLVREAGRSVADIDYLNTVASSTLDLDGVLIDSIRLNHPQGGLAFRFREGKHTMVFITDNELGAARGKRIPEFVEFVRGCDLLIHDAQYLPEEISERRGWGHSTYEEVVALAKEAEVHNLLLTHHDPSRSDAEVEKIIILAREHMSSPCKLRYIDAAREGACYRLP